LREIVVSDAIVHGPGAVGAASRRFPRRFRAQIPIHEAARGRSYQPVNAYSLTIVPYLSWYFLLNTHSTVITATNSVHVPGGQ
jgi:hypothetical protein